MIDNCVENNMKSEVIVVSVWWLGCWWYVALFTFAFAAITSPLGMFIFSNPGTLSFGRPYINVTSLSSCKADIYVTNTTDSSSRLTIHVWIMISICLSSPRYPITVTDADNTPPFYNNTTFQKIKSTLEFHYSFHHEKMWRQCRKWRGSVYSEWVVHAPPSSSGNLGLFCGNKKLKFSLPSRRMETPHA